MDVTFKEKESNVLMWKNHTLDKNIINYTNDKRQKKLHFCSGSNHNLLRYFSSTACCTIKKLKYQGSVSSVDHNEIE